MPNQDFDFAIMAPMNAVLHIAINETVSFVRSYAAAGSAVLDVGCGDGSVAAALQQAGFLVTAIDRNDQSVFRARSLGVNASQADFLDYVSPDRFDVVFMSRALHHIHPVDRAVAKILQLVKPDGLVILEEFGVELMDPKSALWFYGIKSVLEAEICDDPDKTAHRSGHESHRAGHARASEPGGPKRSHGPRLENVAIPGDLLANWNDHHLGKHEVVSSAEILKTISEAKLEVVHQSYVPYLYRYFAESVSAEKLETIFRWEERLCEAGSVVPIGVRVVAKATP